MHMGQFQLKTFSIKNSSFAIDTYKGVAATFTFPVATELFSRAEFSLLCADRNTITMMLWPLV